MACKILFKFMKGYVRRKFWSKYHFFITLLQMPKSQERNQNITKHSNTYNGGLFLLKKKKENQTFPLPQLANERLEAKQAQKRCLRPTRSLSEIKLTPSNYEYVHCISLATLELEAAYALHNSVC